MKRILKEPIFEIALAVLLLFVPLFIVAKISDYTRINLGKIKWGYLSENSSSLYFGNACLLERCGISLWAEYPYVYGHYSRGGKTAYFIVDLSEESPVLRKIADTYVLDEFQKRNLSNEKITTFWSLKGQWGDAAKLSILERNAMGNVK